MKVLVLFFITWIISSIIIVGIRISYIGEGTNEKIILGEAEDTKVSIVGGILFGLMFAITITVFIGTIIYKI